LSVRTAPEIRLGDLDDGPLLDRLDGRIDVLITVDKSLRFQQDLSPRTFGVIVLRARSNRLGDLKPLAEKVLAALPTLEPGRVKEIA
jgi:hypothetical protein